MPDKIKEVFELISDKGYFSDENEFRSYVSDPKRRAEAFELIKDDGFFTDENEFNSYFGEVKKKDFRDFNQKYGTSHTREQFIGQEPISPPISSTVSPSASKQPKSTTPLESTGKLPKLEFQVEKPVSTQAVDNKDLALTVESREQRKQFLGEVSTGILEAINKQPDLYMSQKDMPTMYGEKIIPAGTLNVDNIAKAVDVYAEKIKKETGKELTSFDKQYVVQSTLSSLEVKKKMQNAGMLTDLEFQKQKKLPLTAITGIKNAKGEVVKENMFQENIKQTVAQEQQRLEQIAKTPNKQISAEFKPEIEGLSAQVKGTADALNKEMKDSFTAQFAQQQKEIYNQYNQLVQTGQMSADAANAEMKQKIEAIGKQLENDTNALYAPKFNQLKQEAEEKSKEIQTRYNRKVQAQFNLEKEKASKRIQEEISKYENALPKGYMKEYQAAFKKNLDSEINLEGLRKINQFSNLGNFEKMQTALMAGMGDVASTVGGSLSYVGVNTGNLQNWVAQSGLYNELPMFSDDNIFDNLTNTDWWIANGVRSVPFTVATMPIGIAGGAGVGLLASALGAAKRAQVIASVIGGGFAGWEVERFLEQGAGFNDAINEGKSVSEAAEIAAAIGKYNYSTLPMNMLQMLPVFSKSFKFLGAAGIEAGAGAFEEINQGWAQAKAKAQSEGQDVSYLDYATSPQAIQEGAIGAAMSQGFTLFSLKNTPDIDKQINTLMTSIGMGGESQALEVLKTMKNNGAIDEKQFQEATNLLNYTLNAISQTENINVDDNVKSALVNRFVAIEKAKELLTENENDLASQAAKELIAEKQEEIKKILKGSEPVYLIRVVGNDVPIVSTKEQVESLLKSEKMLPLFQIEVYNDNSTKASVEEVYSKQEKEKVAEDTPTGIEDAAVSNLEATKEEEISEPIDVTEFLKGDTKEEDLTRPSVEVVETPKAGSVGVGGEVEAKKADIEKRRQEELKRMTYEELSDELKGYSSRLISIKDKIGDSLRIIGTDEKELIISYIKPNGEKSNFSIPVSDELVKKYENSEWTEDDINAKYDAELAALEQPKSEAKEQSTLNKEQAETTENKGEEANKEQKVESKEQITPEYIEKTEKNRKIIRTENIKNNFPVLYERVIKNFSNTAWDSADIRDALSYLISKKPTYKKGMEQLISAQIEAEKLLSELGENADFITKKQLLEKINSNESYSKDQKDVFSNIVNRLKGDRFFDFTNKNIDSDNGYQFSNNLLKAKDADAFIHEVGHWGFYNLLSSEERTRYLEYVKDRFYGTKNKISDDLAIKRENKILDKILESNSEDNFSEYFAEQFRQYVVDGLAPKELESIFEKFKEYLTEIVKLFKDKGYNKDLKPFFDKIIREQASPVEEAVSESKSSEPSKSDKNYQEAQEANSIVSKENPNASVLIQPKGEDLSLTAIYVGKEKRGKGIGSKVLESVKKQANKLGKKVVLDATNELDEETDLERLGNFYEKNGFKKVGENKYEYDPKAKDSSGDIINGTDIEGTKESDITAGTNKGESSENVSVPTKEEVVQVETNKQQEDAVQKQTAGQVPVQPEAKVSKGVEGGKPKAEPKEATEEKQEEVAKKAGISPKNLRDLYNVNRKLFDLDRVKSLASAVAMDRMIGAMAKRAGTTKTEMYGKLKFEKTSEKDLPQGVKMQVDAWHGSPYEFDKFSTEFMGKGEGAQAFGWGLYFTDLESIAKAYAENLSGDEYSYDGKLISKDAYDYLFLADDSYGEDFNENTIKDIAKKAIDKIKKEYIPDFKDIQKTSPSEKQRQVEMPERIKRAKNVIKELQDIIASKEIKEEKNKKLYKVSLHKGKTPNQYTWLEWDKRISDSDREKINSQFNKENLPKEVSSSSNKTMRLLGKESDFKTYRPNPISGNGETFYNDLVRYFLDKGEKTPQKEASLFLLRAGIDGIKYPAESIARGATSDTARGFNYVVFDENAVSIEEVIKFQKDANKARGAVMVTLDGEAVIYALTDPNVSTPLHELAHVFEHYLTDAEKSAVMKAAGTKTWNTQTSEYFARGFEKYLAEGKSPVPALDKLFAKFKEWLTEIYNGIKGSDIDIKLNKKMRDIYSSMLGEEISDGKFPDNLLKIAKELDLSPQQIQNTYNKYDGSKKIEDITTEDYKAARAEGDKIKLEKSKKAFEVLLKEGSVSPTAKKKAAEIKKEVGEKTIKDAEDIMNNIDSIRQQLLDAGVIKSINCKWGK